MNQTLKIAVGADHAGYEVKEAVVAALKDFSVQVVDFGTFSTESVDYPDFANKVSYGVSSGQFDFGILVCCTGIGMSIAANRYRGVRASLVSTVEDAILTRRHNDSNILVLPARHIKVDELSSLLKSYFDTAFEGDRHVRRLLKASGSRLAISDPELAEYIHLESERQRKNIELIASENFTSGAVQEAQGSLLTNKYAEGYPNRRWYGGCEFVDKVEQLAIDRAKKLFGAEHANVQPHSGSQANMAVYFSVLKPGDKILTMDLSHGGHLTHGHFANFSGKLYEVVHYGVSHDTETIDYDALEAIAKECKPQLITAGASAYPRVIDFKRMAEIAHSVGAYLFVDMAHIAGLVAAGVHPSPVPYADFVTTTTHKSLRGPRGGIVLCKAEFAKKLDSTVFPGMQGGPLMHVIAGKAACLGEALKPEFKEYAAQIVKNASAMAGRMAELGYRIISNGTDNHLFLVDMRSKEMNGAEAQETLDKAGITANKNSIPFDTASPMKPSGLRIGTPAVTTRGMKEADVIQVANFIDEALMHKDDEAYLAELRERVYEFNRQFPLPR